MAGRCCCPGMELEAIAVVYIYGNHLGRKRGRCLSDCAIVANSGIGKSRIQNVQSAAARPMCFSTLQRRAPRRGCLLQRRGGKRGVAQKIGFSMRGSENILYPTWAGRHHHPKGEVKFAKPLLSRVVVRICIISVSKLGKPMQLYK